MASSAKTLRLALLSSPINCGFTARFPAWGIAM